MNDTVVLITGVAFAVFLVKKCYRRRCLANATGFDLVVRPNSIEFDLETRPKCWRVLSFLFFVLRVVGSSFAMRPNIARASWATTPKFYAKSYWVWLPNVAGSTWAAVPNNIESILIVRPKRVGLATHPFSC